MSVCFGYEDYPNSTNGFISINGKAPVNLGWAGYKIHEDETSGLIFNSHYNSFSRYVDIEIKNTKDADKYFYVIDVFPHDFWFREESKDLILPDHVCDDIQNNNAKILIIFFAECLRDSADMINPIFNHWGEKYNLPNESIVVISGNISGDEILKDNKYAKHIFHSVWEYEVKAFCRKMHIFTCIKNFFDEKPELFLCYNRRARKHRVSLINSLYESHMLDKGLVSLRLEKGISLHKDLYRRMPLTIRNVNLEINQASNITTQDYLDTYFSVVTETEYQDGLHFPSEKIFKPIVSFHPFFVLSSPFFLEKFKQLGYQTFSKWFNEDYDKETDLQKRIDIIVDEIKRLSLLTHDQWVTILRDMYSVLFHNYKVFNYRVNNVEVQKILESEICV